MVIDRVERPRRLTPGELVRLSDGRPYVVNMVNECRAHCVPLHSTPKDFTVADPVTGRPRTIHAHDVGSSVNVSPCAMVERLTIDQLSDSERKRYTMSSIPSASTTASTTGASIVPPAASPKPISKANAAKLAQKPKGEGVKKLSDVADAKAAAKAKLAAAKEKAAAKKAADQAKAAERKAKEQARKEAQAAKKAAKKAENDAAKAARKEARAAIAASKKQVKPCKCGCGEETTAHFVMGHDARFKGQLLRVERGQLKVSELPKAVQTAYKWVKKGDGFIPTTNYKGEPHKGYDLGK